MTDGLHAAVTGQRVLVTGGAGVIGGEMLRQLSTAGAEVLSVDRLPVEDPPAGVRHHVLDLGSDDLTPLAAFQPRFVLHLAATFERSIESPEFWPQNWNDNVGATHRLAELAERIRGIEAMVFASSYLIYDPHQYFVEAPPDYAITLSEDARIGARNLCGAAKLYGEAELRFVREVRRAPFRTVSARIFRVYGRGSRDVVSRWVRAALDGQAIDVYHPENQFDYVYSADVADGLLRMAVTTGAEGILNLASGQSRPVADVISTIERITGTTLAIRRQEVDEPFEASCADLGRLRAVLDWTPTTMLEAGVEQLVAFERARRGNDRFDVSQG